MTDASATLHVSGQLPTSGDVSASIKKRAGNQSV
jgi:hypothetical protein